MENYIEVLQAKIHRAEVTEANLYYEGSITIDKALLKASGLCSYQKVQVVNINNGERFDTYIIEGQEGSGQIGLNGAAARKVQVKDLIIIMAYTWIALEQANQHQPILVFPQAGNHL